MSTKALQEINKELQTDGARLVAVSKTKPTAQILELYNAGQRVFGENKVHELVNKYEQLPKDIEWHFIGHLQTNKVKALVPIVSMIHSVDSIKLLEEINKQASKYNRVVNCLLQIHIAEENTKYGFSKEELLQELSSSNYQLLHNIRICGLMGMATNTNDLSLVDKEFKSLKALFVDLKNHYFNGESLFNELSMGMSSDYKIALKNGSTLIRIGSALFGER